MYNADNVTDVRRGGCRWSDQVMEGHQGLLAYLGGRVGAVHKMLLGGQNSGLGCLKLWVWICLWICF